MFTFTRDKLFTGGVGLTNPIGRMVRIPWPTGLEAQAVTAGPAPSKARMDITRQDGQPFSMESYTIKLLANTAGAGAALEIMPLLNGEDAVPDPYRYDATGVAGNVFTYNAPELTGFEAYKMTLYVDYALTGLTVVDPSLPPPVLEAATVAESGIQLSWPTTAAEYKLEFTTNLTAGVWEPVTDNVTTNGDLIEVQLEASGAQRCFRLSR